MYPSPLRTYQLNTLTLPAPSTATVDSPSNVGFTVGSHLVLTWLGLDAGTANLLSRFAEPANAQFRMQDAVGNWSQTVTVSARVYGAQTYGALWPNTLAAGVLGAAIALPAARLRRLTLVLTFPLPLLLKAAHFPAQV